MQLGFPTKFCISFVLQFFKGAIVTPKLLEKLKVVLGKILWGKQIVLKGMWKSHMKKTMNGFLVYIIASRVNVSALTYNEEN